MSNFCFEQTPIDGVMVITAKRHEDARGYFMETYQREAFVRAGITNAFVQDNQAKSSRGVLRGLHFQRRYPQAKLVRVLSGEVFDVAADIREGSDTYGQYVGIHLSGQNNKMLFVPKGFAHGYLVLSEEAVFSYKCDDFYHPEEESGILWSDPVLAIKWPIEQGMQLIISEKDRALRTLGNYSSK